MTRPRMVGARSRVDALPPIIPDTVLVCEVDGVALYVDTFDTHYVIRSRGGRWMVEVFHNRADAAAWFGAQSLHLAALGTGEMPC